MTNQSYITRLTRGLRKGLGPDTYKYQWCHRFAVEHVKEARMLCELAGKPPHRKNVIEELVALASQDGLGSKDNA